MKLSLVIFLILLSAGVTSAASFADYQKRVDAARRVVDLKGEVRSQQELAAEVVRLVPAHERIEWPGGSVETDNTWLADSLETFRVETDPAARSAVLESISERLGAISETTKELEASTAADRSKDQDKQKLAEILRRQEYQKPEAKEESLFQKWMREFWDWLARVFPRPSVLPNAPSGLGSLQFGLQILIYALVIGLVGFLIYKFAPFLMRRYGGKTKKDKQDRVILGERIGADESALDLFSEAEMLAREGNLRAAIRKGYIALLCDLSDRKIVRLARHKTNRDYLRDVRKDNKLFENMTGLTRNFETNWYGLRTTEPADWEDFRTRYMKTMANVRN